MQRDQKHAKRPHIKQAPSSKKRCVGAVRDRRNGTPGSGAGHFPGEEREALHGTVTRKWEEWSGVFVSDTHNMCAITPTTT